MHKLLNKRFLLLEQRSHILRNLAVCWRKKRDLMAKLLTDVGFKPTIPEGGYFMMADTSDIGKASLIDKPFPCTRIRVDLESDLKYRPFFSIVRVICQNLS